MFRIKPRRTSRPRSRLNMTPMIDIVFNLLVFFIMTFKIIAPEGDFGVQMPQTAAAVSVTQLDSPEPIRIRLRSDSQGNLRDIQFSQRSLGTDMRRLRREVKQYIGPDMSRATDIAAELDVDSKLRYNHTMDAITMISGELDEHGQTRPLLQKISFAGGTPQ